MSERDDPPEAPATRPGPTEASPERADPPRRPDAVLRGGGWLARTVILLAVVAALLWYLLT